jgi:hypothetical protein
MHRFYRMLHLRRVRLTIAGLYASMSFSSIGTVATMYNEIIDYSYFMSRAHKIHTSSLSYQEFQNSNNQIISDIRKQAAIQLCTQCVCMGLSYAFPILGLMLISYNLVDHTIHISNMMTCKKL